MFHTCWRLIRKHPNAALSIAGAWTATVAIWFRVYSADLLDLSVRWGEPQSAFAVLILKLSRLPGVSEGMQIMACLGLGATAAGIVAGIAKWTRRQAGRPSA